MTMRCSKSILLVALLCLMFVVPSVGGIPTAHAVASLATPNSSVSSNSVTTAPVIPLVSTFINISVLTNWPIPITNSQWNALVHNATFQTLYQEYGPSSLGANMGYSGNQSFYGYIIYAPYGTYYWDFVSTIENNGSVMHTQTSFYQRASGGNIGSPDTTV
ncbi:MAG: hypothetical protein JRN19_03410 [Nitrososphaerota archaeon]|nr:hypothetical protein [Nitrososphaerota archaeon]MDG7051479.1 hypothetical protein [Nitrososphaerota archaeon]